MRPPDGRAGGVGGFLILTGPAAGPCPRRRAVLVGLAFLLSFLLARAGAATAEEKAVGVLISREIAPYAAMVEGLESRLNEPVKRFFFDERGQPFTLAGRSASFDPKGYDLLVAVGPEALQYLAPLTDARRLVYGMVLHPRAALRDPPVMPCGVSLDLPPATQFAAIRKRLPNLRRLGVLFDPANNQAWFEEAKPLAEAQGFTLAPLRVNRQGEGLELVGDYTGLDAILFIPDKSVISKAIIQYVIKQGVLRKTPVIGYNQFFYDSGAALAFLIDYRGVGEQVAGQAERLLAGGKCEEEAAPRFELAINQEVWRALGLPEAGR